MAMNVYQSHEFLRYKLFGEGSVADENEPRDKLDITLWVSSISRSENVWAKENISKYKLDYLWSTEAFLR